MKDKVGRKLGKGGDIAEGLRKPTDLTLRDTSSFVLWEFSVRPVPVFFHRIASNITSANQSLSLVNHRRNIHR